MHRTVLLVAVVGLLLACDRVLPEGVPPSRTQGNEPERGLSVAEGFVKWWWYSDPEEEGIIITSPVVRFEGDEEIAYAGADYPNKLFGFAMDTQHPSIVFEGLPVNPLEENVFEGHGSWCELTGHLLIGNEDGELYAFNTNGVLAWRFPGVHPDSMLGGEWGAAAVRGNLIYIANHSDTLFLLRDLGSSVRLEAVRYIPGIGEGCIVDDYGYCYVANDSGDLYKLSPDLGQVVWRARLAQPNPLYFLNMPVLDRSDRVFVGDCCGRVHARSTVDGSWLWTAALTGDVYRLVVGSEAVFAVTAAGWVYSLNPATGDVNWATQVSHAGEFISSPLLTDGGMLICQDDNDFVYCLRRDNGLVVWWLDCQSQGPNRQDAGVPRPRRGRDFDRLEASLSITSRGDLLVVGEDAFYCVTGFPLDGLDTEAPWPKWQRDAANSGWLGF